MFECSAAPHSHRKGQHETRRGNEDEVGVHLSYVVRQLDSKKAECIQHTDATEVHRPCEAEVPYSYTRDDRIADNKYSWGTR